LKLLGQLANLILVRRRSLEPLGNHGQSLFKRLSGIAVAARLLL
jgi:hypothetical protein